MSNHQSLPCLVDTLIQELNFIQSAVKLGKEAFSHLKDTGRIVSNSPGILSTLKAGARHILDIDRNPNIRRAGIEMFRTPTGKIVRLLNKPISMIPTAGAGIYGAYKVSDLKDTVNKIDDESKTNIKKVIGAGIGATALGATTGYIYGKSKLKKPIQENTIFGHASSLLFNPFSNAYFTVKSPLDIIKDTNGMEGSIQKVKDSVSEQSKIINGVGLGIGSAALGYQLLKKKKDK